MQISQVSHLIKSNKDNSFLIYPSMINSSSSKNVFFLGSCRMAPLMYYFHLLYPEYNLYNIYIPHWTNTSSVDRIRIQSILDNTSYLITETIRNFDIFNTDRSIENNFFDIFPNKAQEIRICNLELHMYHYDLHSVYNVENDKKYEAFINSKNKLKQSLESKKQNFVWNYIDDNLQKIRLFATHNHPTLLLSIATFLSITQQLNTKVDILFWEKIINHHFLDNYYTPILPIDIEVYGFRFPCAIFPNSTIHQKQYLYPPTENEKIISLTNIQHLLSYLL